ncbi:fluoride efflux transporter FluC [Nocardioides jiangxiensis]|uniref:Fluoride-specific ion channel FluC n=1 Tax=Nocardioides jiangxiensis TaxID=3064524 RepID=A0ABT9AZ74_9ACTN|nr:CrcB family protein [Nocardioides sp. WY-20]MDO7867890.1 CrcB family protein [Nocardioides sp. WY-20]
MRQPPRPLFVVAAALGGAAGALARWGVDQAWPAGTGFPWGTLTINITGSFLLALLPAFATVRRHPVLPVLLGTGVLGGWTTLSTYANQSRSLIAEGHGGTALTYVATTLVACVLAVRLAHVWSSPAAQEEFEAEEGNE